MQQVLIVDKGCLPSWLYNFLHISTWKMEKEKVNTHIYLNGHVIKNPNVLYTFQHIILE